METKELNLSRAGQKRVEEIALAAFHNLLLGVVENVNAQLTGSAISVAQLQHVATTKVMEQVNKPSQ